MKRRKNRRLTEAENLRIRKMLLIGMTIKSIHKETGYSASTISAQKKVLVALTRMASGHTEPETTQMEMFNDL